MSERSRFLVSPRWLYERLGRTDVRVVDASWYLPAQNRNGKAEYAAAHIEGAVFFDIDAVADTSSGLPHMLLGPADFAEAVGAMGISDTDTIVVYDGAGLFSAARVWWNFKVMGAENVFILDGGLPGWKTAGFPVTAAPSRPAAKSFTPRFNASAVKSKSGVSAAIHSKSAQIVDARPAVRFSGDAPEPRPGLRAGHMPGAKSVPFQEIVQDGMLKDLNALQAVFENAGIDLSAPIVATCGSGVSAALVDLALTSLNAPEHSVYDGAWAEWGLPGDAPVVAGKD
jgi:thiosulfate/3-mercaptopyruvate sulfurtransferase